MSITKFGRINMKFIKKFNEYDEGFELINENEYEKFREEKESETFHKNEIEYISKLTRSRLPKSKIIYVDYTCNIQIEISARIGLYLNISKFEDEWFLISIDDTVSYISTDRRKIKIGWTFNSKSETTYAKADQISGLISFLNFISDEISKKT